MRFFLSILVLTFTYISSAKADVYYCNATSTILMLFQETEGRPIYTQNMAPYPEALKFKRESDRIILKHNYENENYRNHRNYLSLLAKDLKKLKIEDKNLSLLTLDPRLMVWSLMNDIKDIRLISGQIVPKTHNMIEEDLNMLTTDLYM